MTQSNLPDRPRLVERLPTFVYALLVTIAAVTGAIVFSISAVAAMVVFGVADAPFSTLAFVGSAALGLVCGVLMIRRQRDRSGGKPRSRTTPDVRAPAHPFSKENLSPSCSELDDWYYVASGARRGPISEAELQRLIAVDVINSETHVWRRGLIDWTSASKAGIDGLSLPPVVSSEKIGNGAVWVMAFLPLIIAIGDELLTQAYIDQQNAKGAWFIIVPKDVGVPLISCLALTLFLTVSDLNRLYKAGYRPTSLLLSSAFTPLYLFMRASLLKQAPYYGFAWLACAAIAIFAG